MFSPTTGSRRPTSRISTASVRSRTRSTSSRTTMQPAADLLAWAVPNPTGALVASAQEALHTRMTDAAWRDLDAERQRPAAQPAPRRARGLHPVPRDPPTRASKTPDQLYEHFLVDVQMDACMQTSRIRLALSTVQLFVTRCLMNLEADVSPASIRADRWQWMQRYRVWEANRKVFVYPENWLEPELRDNKSPFFRELESELLKSDITDDARRGGVPLVPQEARRRRQARGRRGVPAPAAPRQLRTTTSSTSSAARTASRASTTRAGSSTATGRRGRRCR